MAFNAPQWDPHQATDLPLAHSMDPYTLAYCIVLLKEGLFGKKPCMVSGGAKVCIVSA